jgi:glutaredoxin-related protein
MRPLLPESNIDLLAQKSIESFHADIVNEVKEAVGKNKIVVVGMAQNPVVKAAKKNLKERGIDFKYIGYGSYMGKWKQRLAIKLWSGWPTFPQVFIDGKLIGGNAELKLWLAKNKI